MSTEPTQPMSPSAPADSDSPEQPELRKQEAGKPESSAPAGAAPAQEWWSAGGAGAAGGAGGVGAAGAQEAKPVPVTPTRVEPVLRPEPGGRPAWSDKPSFTPAQPSFTPVQPGQPRQPAQPAQPGQPPEAAQSGQEGGRQPGGSAGPAGRNPGQTSWPEQPPQYTPQPGQQDWPQPPYDGAQGGQPAVGRLGYPAGPPPRRRRRVRRWVMALFAIIVLLILATIGDRVANAVAENTMADQFVKNGFPVKPSVTIEGFPFLTQLLAHDFQKVDISASNIPAGQVTITSAKATLNGMHFNSSFNGATIDHVSVILFVSFSALANAGGLGDIGSLTMAPDGPNKLKITAGIAGQAIDTEEVQISQAGPREISLHVLNGGGALGGLLSSFGDFSFTLPQGVPASLRITGLTLNAQGLTVTAAANHAVLSQPSS